MDIVTRIYSLPNSWLFILIFLGLSLFSAISLYFVEKFVPLRFRYHENNSIGYVGSTIGVIYAVLAGFIIFYVMDNFQKASDLTRKEAASTAKIYRDSTRVPASQAEKIQLAMQDYLATVINQEWPLMSHDKTSDAAESILDSLILELNSFTAKNNQELLSMQMVYNELDELYKNRDERVDLANAALAGDLWILLVVSTLLTLFVKSLAGMKFRLHLAMQIVVTLMLTSILFLIIVLDRPFRGQFSIKPVPFQEILLDIQAKSKYGQKR